MLRLWRLNCASTKSSYNGCVSQRNTFMPASMEQLHPNEDFTKDVGRRLTRDNWNKEIIFGDSDIGNPSVFTSPSHSQQPTTATEVFIGSAKRCDPEDDSRRVDKMLTSKGLHDYEWSDEEISHKLQDMTDDLESLTLSVFHGKSSGALLIKSMIEAKGEATGLQPSREHLKKKLGGRSVFWTLSPVRYP